MDKNKMFQIAAHATSLDVDSDYPEAPFITYDDIDRIRIIYHGSNASPDIIRKNGILTRGSRKLSNIGHDPLNIDAVYIALLKDAAAWYGLYVYQIDFNGLDKSLLAADDDACGHSRSDDAYHWQGSLQIMGTCQYNGSIPPNLILGVLHGKSGGRQH